MSETTRTPSVTKASLFGARRWFFGIMVLEFAVFGVVASFWLFFLAPEVRVWWLLAPLLVLNFAFSLYAEHKVICPACRHSLMDHDGFGMFAKTCEHCGTPFR